MLDIYTDAFLRVGLTMNVAKTKAMIMEGQKCHKRTARPIAHQDITSKQFQAMKVCCDKCKCMVGKNYLKKNPRNEEMQK